MLLTADRGPTPNSQIDYYGVTFDHLVPADERNPEVLQIDIIETDEDAGAYANEYLRFAVDPAANTGKKVLAVPRCFQTRKGTQDRGERDRDWDDNGISINGDKTDSTEYWRLHSFPAF
ncbi:MAG: hypothetical protein M1832_003402 [Thelocarpon impressellum]|nr:MAG: hypothetical protein M1832_003402 [Thelocarpon impressellum]